MTKTEERLKAEWPNKISGKTGVDTLDQMIERARNANAYFDEIERKEIEAKSGHPLDLLVDTIVPRLRGIKRSKRAKILNEMLKIIGIDAAWCVRHGYSEGSLAPQQIGRWITRNVVDQKQAQETSAPAKPSKPRKLRQMNVNADAPAASQPAALDAGVRTTAMNTVASAIGRGGKI